MTTFNFSANAIDFGNWEGETVNEAVDRFASDAGYMSWDAMVKQAEEFGGNSIEIREVLENGQLGPLIDIE